MPLEALACIGEASGGGEPRASADDHGIYLVEGFVQALERTLATAGRRVREHEA